MMLLPALITLFVLSGIGKSNGHHKGIYWAGIFWAAFGVLFLATLVFSVVVAIRAVRRRTAASTSSM